MDQDYNQTIAEIFDLQKYAIKLGLHNITKLLAIYRNPHISYPVIHIAGTNGKGTTAAVLAKILSNHGFNTGLYTSPHLVDFRERIRVNDQFIDQEYIQKFWQEIKAEVYKLKATFFDTTTCLAFKYFKDRKIDIAIIETGLGGRLDSTNVVKPEAAVITAIGFDHQKQLGQDLEMIAAEKAGIIKKGTALFIGNQQNNLNTYFYKYKDLVSRLIEYDKSIVINEVESNLDKTFFTFHDVYRKENFNRILLNLTGIHQIENTLLAYLVSRWYIEKVKKSFEHEKFRESCEKIIWPARFQKVKENPTIVFDVSHNIDGFRRTMEIVRNLNDKNHKKLLIGLLNDKNGEEILKEISGIFDEIIITEPRHHRKMPAQKLLEVLKNKGVYARMFKNSQNAFKRTIKKLKKDDFLLITGSHFLIGEYMQYKIEIT